MSHTNTTTNYGLPQFLSSDKPAWMADINVAFADIDGQMKTNADAASAAQSTANDAVLNGAPGYSNLSTYAVGDVVNYLGRVYKCDIAVTTPEAFDNAKWTYYRLSDASAQLDVIDDEIGSTDISGIGDGSITGAISTINSDLSNPTVEDIQNLHSYFSKNFGGYIKVGKIVILNVSIKTITSLVAGGSYQLGSMPAPIAPLTLECVDNQHDYKISATVDSNGVITFINNDSSQITSDRIFISGAYVSAN